MIVPTVREHTYEISSSQRCEVTTRDGSLICVAEANTPVCFVAGASSVVISDASAVVKQVVFPMRHQRHLTSCRIPAVDILPKYGECTSVEEVQSVQPEYVSDIEAGVWRYSLSSLEIGDSMFSSVVSLRDFLTALPFLQSGKNMFYGCVLSLCSVKIIAHSIPKSAGAVMTLGIDIRQKNSSELAEALKLMESKGWLLEVQYNTPSNVPTLAELEYLESDGSQYINTETVPHEKQRIEMVGISLTATRDECFLGSRSGAGYATRIQMFCDSARLVKTYRVNDINVNLSVNPTKPTTSVLDLVNRKAMDDGMETSIPYSGKLATNPYFLFSRNSDNGAETQYNLRGRIFSCLIYENGVCIRDFIPVLDETGEACMFDRISKRYFRNIGTGKFKWALKATTMNWRNREVVTLVDLPQSPIWARKHERRVEWCHYTTDTREWQQFTSVIEAQEILGINDPM